jgi:hypothetical protein
MLMRALFLLVVLVLGCPPADEGKSRTPAGTLTDPVDKCERAGDVCRIDDSRLGVCTIPKDPSVCEQQPCLICAPQH